MKEPQPVYIEWDDSWSHHGWLWSDEVDGEPMLTIRQVGFIVKEDKDWLVLAMGYHPNKDKTDYCYTDPFWVPGSVISKRRRIGDLPKR